MHEGRCAERPRRCRRLFGQSAALAQSVEHLTRNEKVVGSIPTGGSHLTRGFAPFWRVGFVVFVPLCVPALPVSPTTPPPSARRPREPARARRAGTCRGS